MDYETVVFRKEDRVGTILLNRPEKLNAIDDALLRDLEAALKEVEEDTDIWLVVIKGAGEAFSVGQDLSGIGTAEVMPPDPRTKPYLSDLFEAAMRYHRRWQAISDFPRFKVAQVHGYCLGAGCDLAMACNTIIAAEDAIFGDPSIRMGLVSPNPWWTWKVGLKQAKELLLTGKYIDAREAERSGLVMKVVPRDELEDAVKTEVEVQTKLGTIGGYDMQVGWRLSHEANLDLAGMAAAGKFHTFLRALSAIQRPGRSIIDRGEFNFYEVRDKKGLRAAIEERDAPFRGYFPPPQPKGRR